MNKYLILQNPGHNRVYYNLAGELALAELKVALNRFTNPCENVGVEIVKGIRYLTFTSEEELIAYELEILSRLSFVFALFKVKEEAFYPIEKLPVEYVDEKISSLQKYPGKTNELFTKMMLNVGLLSSDFDFTDNIKLLDPIAGKGTTLYEGLIYGFNVSGIEIDPKSTHAVGIFFKKYLEKERYKHLADTRQVHGASTANGVFMKEFEFVTDKTDFKTPELRKKFELVTGSSQLASSYFKKGTFHLLVGDLPYGIAHNNSSEGIDSNVSRSPLELLEQCLPEWYKVLKVGGVAVIAWNSFLISKVKVRRLFAECGFTVLDDEVYDEFEHKVDQSIKRDIVVAKKIK